MTAAKFLSFTRRPSRERGKQAPSALRDGHRLSVSPSTRRDRLRCVQASMGYRVREGQEANGSTEDAGEERRTESAEGLMRTSNRIDTMSPFPPEMPERLRVIEATMPPRLRQTEYCLDCGQPFDLDPNDPGGIVCHEHG